MIVQSSIETTPFKFLFKQKKDVSYDFTKNLTVDEYHSPGRYVPLILSFLISETPYWLNIASGYLWVKTFSQNSVKHINCETTTVYTFYYLVLMQPVSIFSK